MKHFYKPWCRCAECQGRIPVRSEPPPPPRPPSLTPRVARVPDPPRPHGLVPPPGLETPSEGAFRAALQLTEEKTLLRAAWVIEQLAHSEPEKATRDIYARIAQALRQGVNL